ncbi:MAG: biopolymer transporter ExbD [Bacteroidales bacterium]|nr:biopolymer transporter ExbD [Bacteroidales bacterium]
MARKTPEINGSSLADIAFLLLIFFLVTTTMNVDTGLNRMLPPMPEQNTKQEDIEVKKRNMLAVKINKSDRLLVAGEPMEVYMLKDKAKEFIMNPNEDEHLPELKEVDIPLIGRRKVSEGVISLQNDNGTTYRMYMLVQNELVAAYNELREDLAKTAFGKLYSKLTPEEQEAVDKAIPQRISEAEPKNVGGQ